MGILLESKFEYSMPNRDEMLLAELKILKARLGLTDI